MNSKIKVILLFAMLSISANAQTNVITKRISTPVFNHPDYSQVTNEIAVQFKKRKELGVQAGEISQRQFEREKLHMASDPGDKMQLSYLAKNGSQIDKYILQLRQQELTLRLQYHLDDPYKRPIGHHPPKNPSK